MARGRPAAGREVDRDVRRHRPTAALALETVDSRGGTLEAGSGEPGAGYRGISRPGEAGRRRTSGAPPPTYNPPMHFEDFSVGDTFVTEEVEVTAEDIVEYARRYDPQPFHLDPEAARESIYGGLIASGFHIFSMAFGAIARTGIFEGGGQGSPGIHDVRWVSPARPGDTLHTGIEVLDKRLSRTRADRGYVTMRFDTRNQHGDLVATYTSNQILLRREPGPA